MTIVIRYRAAKDIIESTGFLHSRRPSSAVKFTERLNRAMEILARSPQSGADLGLVYKGLRIRSMAIRGFQNYLILHAPHGDDVIIARVVDGRRDLAALLS